VRGLTSRAADESRASLPKPPLPWDPLQPPRLILFMFPCHACLWGGRGPDETPRLGTCSTAVAFHGVRS
jgi:hypothetical protein